MEEYLDKEFDDVTFICPICTDIFIETTQANCRHQFCKYCISLWGKYSNHCPVCAKQLRPLTTCPEVDLEIKAFYERSTDAEIQTNRTLAIEAREAAYQNFKHRLMTGIEIDSTTAHAQVTQMLDIRDGKGDGSRKRFMMETGQPRRSHLSCQKYEEGKSDPGNIQAHASTSYLSRVPPSFMTSGYHPNKLLPIPLRAYGEPSLTSLLSTNSSVSYSTSSAKLSEIDHATQESVRLEKSLSKTYSAVFELGREITKTEDLYSWRYFKPREEASAAAYAIPHEGQGDCQACGDLVLLENNTQFDYTEGGEDDSECLQSEPSSGEQLKNASNSASTIVFHPDGRVDTVSLAASKPGFDQLRKEAQAADRVQEFLKQYSLENILKSSDDEDETDEESEEDQDDVLEDHLLKPRLRTFKVHPEVQAFLDTLKTKIKPRIPDDMKEQEIKQVEECRDLFRRIRHEYADNSNANDEAVPMSTVLDVGPKFTPASFDEQDIEEFWQLAYANESVCIGGNSSDEEVEDEGRPYYERSYSKLNRGITQRE